MITKDEILKQFSERGWFEVEFDGVGMWITARPTYCNRGAFQWNAESNNYKITIDFADGFPRYYFLMDSMVNEINAWLEKRKIQAPQ